jgi:chromosomal replication initiator protein
MWGAITAEWRSAAGESIFPEATSFCGRGARTGAQEVVKDDSDRLSVLRRELRRTLGDKRYELWLGGETSLVLEGNTLRVRCTSQTEVQWFRRKLSVAIEQCTAAAFGPSVETVFEAVAAPPVQAAQKPCTAGAQPHCREAGWQTTQLNFGEDVWRSSADGGNRAVAAADAPREPKATQPPVEKTRRWTFGDFVVGMGNRLAAQAAREAAQQPGRFSPLLVHGAHGVGKSHLLSAIAQQVRLRQRMRVVQLTAEQFTTQFLEAMERRALPGFRQKMRSLDVLLIDDVQFFAGKRATVEELLYTLDALHARGGQVVLSSDQPAIELQAVSPDLANRVSAGLTVAMDPPDYETRAGIVRVLAERMQLSLEQEVVETVAQQAVGSGRLLSGAINRLVAVSMAVDQPITKELAEFALIEFCRQHTPQVKLSDIQRAVCEVFGVESASLKSQRKTRAIAEPRMLAMWLARRYTRAALSEIGDFFGRRSHSTVVSAQKKFDKLISQRGELVVGDQSCPVDEALRRIEAKLRSA